MCWQPLRPPQAPFQESLRSHATRLCLFVRLTAALPRCQHPARLPNPGRLHPFGPRPATRPDSCATPIKPPNTASLEIGLSAGYDLQLVGAPLVGALRGTFWRPDLDAIALLPNRLTAQTASSVVSCISGGASALTSFPRPWTMFGRPHASCGSATCMANHCTRPLASPSCHWVQPYDSVCFAALVKPAAVYRAGSLSQQKWPPAMKVALDEFA